MPIRTEEARQAAQARKRFTRTLKRLEDARTQTKQRNAKAQYTQQIKEVKASIRKTYAPKGGWKTEKQKQRLSEAIEKGDKITKTTKQFLGSPQKVKNFNFQQQIKWASSENKRAMSYLETEEVKAFYNITEPIWKDIAPAQRNKKIMEYFDTNDLETAFRRALKKPGVRKQIELGKKMRELKETEQKDWTPEQRQFYEEEMSKEKKQDEGSPIWAMSLPEFDPSKSWEKEVDGEVEK